MEKYKEKYKNINSPNTTISTNIIKDNFLLELFEFEDNTMDIDELQDYLHKPVISPKMDPLEWWKVNFFENKLLFFFFFSNSLNLCLYICFYIGKRNYLSTTCNYGT